MLTVLLATYNGSTTLPNTLEAFRRLQEPAGGWRLVIVDNGSTEPIREVVTPYCEQLPITVVQEPERGKNIALNSGLNSIYGDLVLFSDDDVLPESDWLMKMRAVADSHPSCSIFGGPVLAKWEKPPEDWVQGLDWLLKSVTFAISNPALEEGPVAPHLIWGANMAVRASIFKAGHRFDPTIGPNGSNSYPMGSETEFVERMEKSGFKLWYCRSAAVYHMIRSHQMEKEWALRRAIRFGRGQYRIWAKRMLAAPALNRIPRYLIRRVIIQARISIQSLRVAVTEQLGDGDLVFRERWWLNYHVGKAIESRAMGFKKP